MITNSDEGLEGDDITINGGDINIVASDDSINVSEPDDIPAPLVYFLHINGGHIVVNADGDGIDSNGSIEISGGVVIVNGPTANDNGALDYDGIFNMTGGTLVAVGSAGMPAAPGEASTQYLLLSNFGNALEAGMLVRIQTADSEEILTFAPSKAFQSLVFSSPELAENTTYEVYTGGSPEGTAVDGLYSGSVYTPGSQQASFTISSILTQIGNVRGPRMGR